MWVESAAMLKDATAALLAGRPLSEEDAAAAMGRIMDGNETPVGIAAFLTALRAKGETVPEIAGCARALRARMVRFDAGPGPLLDTCGTGGDGAGTFNVSTAAAFVVAACGVRVAKHGNRAASSACGSADVLEALGVRIEQPKEKLEGVLREVGLVYLHAPGFHPAMKHAGPVRKELGFRTVFNLLGPLCNPAGADVQVVGLFSAALVRPYAEVLQVLGSRAALTVHGHGGLDELSTTGPNAAVELKDGRLRELAVLPGDAGLATGRLDDLKGGTAAENAAIVRSIFAGEKGPRRDIVVLNAAAALALAGKARDLRDGAAQAAHALDAGLARRTLEALVAATA